jgi:hypothetical protein
VARPRRPQPTHSHTAHPATANPTTWWRDCYGQLTQKEQKGNIFEFDKRVHHKRSSRQTGNMPCPQSGGRSARIALVYYLASVINAVHVPTSSLVNPVQDFEGFLSRHDLVFQFGETNSHSHMIVHRTRLPLCATPHMHCALRSRSSHTLCGWPKTLRGWPRHGHDLPRSMNTVATRALHAPSLLTHSVKNLHHARFSRARRRGRAVAVPPHIVAHRSVHRQRCCRHCSLLLRPTRSHQARGHAVQRWSVLEGKFNRQGRVRLLFVCCTAQQ